MVSDTFHCLPFGTLPSTETIGQTPYIMSISDDEKDTEDTQRHLQEVQTALRVPLGTVIDNEPWPPIFTPENVRSAKAMIPRADDVFICTYPKCGTTWIQHITHQLLGKTEYELAAANVDEDMDAPTSSSGHGGDELKAMCYTSPMIERMGNAFCETIKTPRVLKSHFSYENMPKGGGAKYIYACRNVKDCLNSYFHHHRNFKIYDYENGDFSVFYELFMAGNVGFGDYFDHLTSWLTGIQKAEEKILFLTYEDMVADLRSAVIKIGDFLGGASADMVRNEEKLSKIVNNSSLSAMKKNQQRWFPNKQLNSGEFIRKGGSRDWKNQFSYEQSLRMDMRFREQCASTAAAEWWKREMAWNGEENPIRRPAVSLDAGSEVSSYASSATSGFYSASPLSFTASSLDFSSSLSSRLRPPSLAPESDVCYSPAVEGPLDRERLDSLQFPFDSLKVDDVVEERQ